MLVLVSSLTGSGRDIIKCSAIKSRETEHRSMIALVNDEGTSLGEIDLFRERIEILPEAKP